MATKAQLAEVDRLAKEREAAWAAVEAKKSEYRGDRNNIDWRWDRKNLWPLRRAAQEATTRHTKAMRDAGTIQYL